MFSERKFSHTKVLLSTVYAYASCCDKIASCYDTNILHITHLLYACMYYYIYVCVCAYTHMQAHKCTHTRASTHTQNIHILSLLTAQYGSQRQRSARVPPVFTTMINLSSDKPTHTVFVHRASLRCYPLKGLQNFRRGTRLVYVCPLVPIRYQASFGWHAESNLVSYIAN